MCGCNRSKTPTTSTTNAIATLRDLQALRKSTQEQLATNPELAATNEDDSLNTGQVVALVLSAVGLVFWIVGMYWHSYRQRPEGFSDGWLGGKSSNRARSPVGRQIEISW